MRQILSHIWDRSTPRMVWDYITDIFTALRSCPGILTQLEVESTGRQQGIKFNPKFSNDI